MAVILILLALLQFAVALINLVTGPVLKRTETKYNSLVSILVPARNEETNIGRLIESVLAQNYPYYELIILDDFSADKTADIVRGYISGQTRLIHGKPLPDGWIGKSWACHQLAAEAKGQYLMFLDADTCIKDDLINSAIHYLETKKLNLLTLFTGQITLSWGEKITVPVIQYILLTLLPLVAVEKSQNVSLAAANGQFMIFPAASYRCFNWHQRVKDSLAEDIDIMKIMKANKLKTSALMAGKMITCRMYSGFRESINGFSKNIRLIFSGSFTFLFLYLLYYPLILFTAATQPSNGLLLLLILILTRLFTLILTGEKIISNLLLFPLQLISLGCISLLAVYRSYRGQYYWKNRLITSGKEAFND